MNPKIKKVILEILKFSITLVVAIWWLFPVMKNSMEGKKIVFFAEDSLFYYRFLLGALVMLSVTIPINTWHEWYTLSNKLGIIIVSLIISAVIAAIAFVFYIFNLKIILIILCLILSAILTIVAYDF